VPFTLVHAGKYRREDKLQLTESTQTRHNPEKQTTQNTAKQKTTLVESLLRRLSQQISPHGAQGQTISKYVTLTLLLHACRQSPGTGVSKCRPIKQQRFNDQRNYSTVRCD